MSTALNLQENPPLGYLKILFADEQPSSVDSTDAKRLMVLKNRPAIEKYLARYNPDLCRGKKENSS